MNNLEDKKSYGQIFKSTALVGGSQFINILFGIVRTKALAVLLGPVGIGLMGVYNSMTQMISAISALGIGSSAVRQVAEAVAIGDQLKISRTILTLRRLSLFLGLLGALVTALLCTPLSRVSFGTVNHRFAIAILSVTICFAAVSAGQVALLQGMRRIADLATLSVLGSFLGTICCIPMVYYWGERGIVPFLVTVSAITILTSWWYARRVTLLSIKMTWRETFSEAKGLIALGIAFMASAVMTNGTTYLIRVILTRKIGLDGLGLYQAAFTLSSLYIGVILTAMGLDYYPRLTAVSANNETCNRLINQQTEVGLLVAAPGIIATIIFAPFVLQVFYSTKFVGAYGILRWSILGVFLRVISWPIGYLLLAKGKAMVFFLTELTANLVHVALIWGATRMFGLEGTGVAFFGLYVFYTVMILAVGYRFSGFLWSRTNLRLIGFITAFVGAAIAVSLYKSRVVALLFGAVFTAVLTAYCFRKLYLLVGKEWFTGFSTKLKERLGWVKIKSDKD